MINDAPIKTAEQNSIISIVVVDRKPHLCVFAARDIKKGEEIRYDYGVDSLPWRRKKIHKRRAQAKHRQEGRQKCQVEQKYVANKGRTRETEITDVQFNNGPQEEMDTVSVQGEYAKNDDIDAANKVHTRETEITDVQLHNGPQEEMDTVSVQGECAKNDNIDVANNVYTRETEITDVQLHNGPQEEMDNVSVQGECAKNDNIDVANNIYTRETEITDVQLHNGPQEEMDTVSVQGECAKNDNIDAANKVHTRETEITDVQLHNGPQEEMDTVSVQGECAKNDNIANKGRTRETDIMDIQFHNGQHDEMDNVSVQEECAKNVDIDLANKGRTRGTEITDVQFRNCQHEKKGTVLVEGEFAKNDDIGVANKGRTRETEITDVQFHNGPQEEMDTVSVQGECAKNDNIGVANKGHTRETEITDVQFHNGPQEEMDTVSVQGECAKNDNIGMKGRPTIAKRKHKMTGFDARKNTFDCDSSSERSGTDLESSGSEWVISGGDTESSDFDSDIIDDVVPETQTNLNQSTDDNESLPGPSVIQSLKQVDASICMTTKNVPYDRLLSENEKIKCVRNPLIFIKKPSPSNKSKTGRSYDIVHACFYCSKLMTNIQKHVENQHKNKPKVKDILELKRQKETIRDSDAKKEIQRHISAKQAILKNLGDDKHNELVVKDKKGELLLSRRRKGEFNSELYGGCPDCYEWIVLKENYSQHRETCPAETKATVKEAIIQSLVFQGKIASIASQKLKDEVFAIMHKDDITRIAIEDNLIVDLGEIHFMSAIGNRLKRKNYASYRMRLASRLLILICKEINQPHAIMTQCMNVEHFDVIAKCAIIACGENSERELQHPSVAIKLGFDISKMISTKIGFASKEKDETEYKNAKRFKSLLQAEWKLKVKKQASVLLEERRFNKKNDLPDPEDIGKLANYMIGQLNYLKKNTVDSSDDFRRLAMMVEARLLLYNRRRPGELEALTIETYKKRSTGVNETDLSLRSELTKLEMKLLESQELVYLRGKGHKAVPIILPAEVKVPLEMLASKGIRNKGGVNPNNGYMFGTSGNEPIRAGTALDVVKFDAGLKFPLRIYATNLRKHTATISQVMSLKDNELRWLVNHMGHTEKVHLQHYRATSGLIERLDIAKIMLMQEQGLVSKYANVALNDIHFEDLDDPKHSNNMNQSDPDPHPSKMECEIQEFEEFEGEIEDTPQLEMQSKKKPSNPGTRVPWTEKEIGEIKQYFKDYISLQSRKPCPGMKEILQVCAKSKASGGAIWKRNWETIKKKVSYLVQKEKRR